MLPVTDLVSDLVSVARSIQIIQGKRSRKHNSSDLVNDFLGKSIRTSLKNPPCGSTELPFNGVASKGEFIP